MQCAREEAYIGKVSRGLMTARAVEAARKSIKLGDRLTVKEYLTNPFYTKRPVSGRVCYMNEHYFTIHTGKYRESFRFIDLITGRIKLL